jgi:hypothetical protein
VQWYTLKRKPRDISSCVLAVVLKSRIRAKTTAQPNTWAETRPLMNPMVLALKPQG